MTNNLRLEEQYEFVSGNSLDYKFSNIQGMIFTYTKYGVAQDGTFAFGDCDDRDGDHGHSLRQRHNQVLQTQHRFS